MNFIAKLRRSHKAASAIEYSLIAGLIALVAVGIISQIGDKTSNMLNRVHVGGEQ